MPSPPALPDPAVCEQARLSRDPRFDGLFFTAVLTTGIYCRPVCPAPPPKPSNVVYYPNAAAAETAGFRPCLRCRPELSPADGSWHRGDDLVARALKLIDQGALNEAPLAALAERVHLGERQLRRLFVERLGAAPVAVHGTRRLLFAKQLLSETALPVTEVAMAAGFNSLRRFNAVFQQAYGMPPRMLRQRPRAAAGDSLTLRLAYRPPYDFAAMLDFLRGRALPGVEVVDTHGYRRVIGDARSPGWLHVSAWPASRGEPAPHALRLELHGCPPTRMQDTVQRVRRMFDLDADPGAIAAHLARDARLAPLLRRRPGLRLPSGWDGFEIAVRAVIGQQVSVAAARTLTARLSQRFGTPLPDTFAALGLTHLFPSPEALADGDFDGLGLVGARIRTIHGIARALLEGRVDFRSERTLDAFVADWIALPGVGPWTAQYIALRALGHPDAFPAEDLVLQKALPARPAPATAGATRLTARALRAHAEAWRPWRGYAVLHLWREAALASPGPAAGRTTQPRAAATARPRRSTKP
ncbi:helix-turn-helix domain-containing protein [Luteimonas sp. BDR2-5]|uniref:DNA-3-methyladenine glycosylase 2 n=1 Tax=Proluteimonas luteida TaxID=2878685 RepID=UPI001E44D1E3|nr:DNA-3-methyladenine glycosylase 2 [Luteimonas sp. BDR2-5]MCD9028249.1 helix-turn-helix domain-containing protein [Luteimonas sp. BDR2-5]